MDEYKDKLTEIHTLIQERRYGFYEFIREKGSEIDDHVESCEECWERMIAWTVHLPKLRARMTIDFPTPRNSKERSDQLHQLKRGQCLPCGCVVTMVSWTREQAKTKLCKALAEVLQITEDQAQKIPEVTKLLDLPLSTKSLRRLRDKFWFPDGSSVSEEVRDEEEADKVRQLPETIGQLIQQIFNLYPPGCISYTECSDHWIPG